VALSVVDDLGTSTCREERVTTSADARPCRRSACATRRWRAARGVRALARTAAAALDAIALTSTSLPDLAPDLLAGVPHALALVRVGLAQLAQVRRDLADLLLVDARTANRVGASTGT
jgi:hypothetical protein